MYKYVLSWSWTNHSQTIHTPSQTVCRRGHSNKLFLHLPWQVSGEKSKHNTLGSTIAMQINGRCLVNHCRTITHHHVVWIHNRISEALLRSVEASLIIAALEESKRSQSSQPAYTFICVICVIDSLSFRLRDKNMHAPDCHHRSNAHGRVMPTYTLKGVMAGLKQICRKFEMGTVESLLR